MTDPRLQRVAIEWRQNRRLRLGALVILLVLGAQATLALSDRRTAKVQQYQRDAELLARLDEASRESAWPQRAKAAESALAAVRASIPAARTDGLAQAEMQAWLTDLAGFAGLTQPTVRVETSLPVPGQDGMWQVLARLDAVVPDGRMPLLARTLSAALPWVRTERLDVQAGRDTRLSLVVRGYFRQSDDKSAAAAQQRPANLPAAGAQVAPVAAPVNPLARLAPAAEEPKQNYGRPARGSLASERQAAGSQRGEDDRAPPPRAPARAQARPPASPTGTRPAP